MPGKYTPRPEQIPSGFCECGCGGRTEIADRTFSKWRWFAGHPKPFIKGHHAKHNHLCNRGPQHPAWKGGKYKHKSGYIYVYQPNHPAHNADGYVLEHRLVAEGMVNRLLTPNEHPHHINGIRDDNRPENIVVLTHIEHSRLHGSDTFRRIRGDNTDEWRKHCVEAGKKGAASKWAGHTKQEPNHTCERCGNPFYAIPSAGRRFCSKKCAGIVDSTETVCPICGKTFKDSPSAKRRYCSRACFTMSRRHLNS